MLSCSFILKGRTCFCLLENENTSKITLEFCLTALKTTLIVIYFLAESKVSTSIILSLVI